MASEDTPSGEEGNPPPVGAPVDTDTTSTDSQTAKPEGEAAVEPPAGPIDQAQVDQGPVNEGQDKPVQTDPGATDTRAGDPRSEPIDLSGLTKDKARDDGIPAGPPAGGSGPVTPHTDAGTRTVVAINPYSVDQTRQMIAIWLLASLFGIIAVEALFSAILGFNCWIYGMCSTRAAPAVALITNTIQPIFTAMVGLVGSVVGFYFGSQKQ